MGEFIGRSVDFFRCYVAAAGSRHVYTGHYTRLLYGIGCLTESDLKHKLRGICSVIYLQFFFFLLIFQTWSVSVVICVCLWWLTRLQAADQTFIQQLSKSMKGPCGVLTGVLQWKPLICFCLILNTGFYISVSRGSWYCSRRLCVSWSVGFWCPLVPKMCVKKNPTTNKTDHSFCLSQSTRSSLNHHSGRRRRLTLKWW